MFVTYHYPPSSAVGGIRINGFAKYLIQYGWKVYIITVKEKYAQILDYERCTENKQIEIYRTNVLPKLSKNILKGVKKLGYKKNRINHKKKKKYLDNQNFGEEKERSIEVIKKIINSFLLLPDENRNWILPGILKSWKIIKEKNIKIIVTSCPPFSAHIIGLTLKYLFGKIWVADYRDPWIQPFNKQLYPTCKASLTIEKFFENLVIQKADMVISTTENLKNKFIEIYGDKARNKFIYLSNGFDNDIFNKINSPHKYDIFTISYTGTFYFGRSPEPIFEAICRLKEKGLVKGRDLRIKLVGNCENINGLKTNDVAKKYNLISEIEICSTVSYKEAIRIIKKSHLGLVLAPKQVYQIPGKIYDLIGSETKVLAISDNGATKTLVETLGVGKCFHWKDIEGIKNFIYGEFTNSKKENINWEKVKYKFDQKEITKKLSSKLNELLA